jgi:hypothetical protein
MGMSRKDESRTRARYKAILVLTDSDDDSVILWPHFHHLSGHLGHRLLFGCNVFLSFLHFLPLLPVTCT